jgi:RNA polymerase sigma-70 factor, ECF subfamily
LGDLGLGDSEALRALLDRHLAWLLRIASRLSMQRADAKDVVQETVAAVIAKPPQLTAKSNFRAYLYGEARNAVRRVSSESTFASVDALSAPEEPMLSLREQDLLAALEGLAPEHREVVVLKIVRGLTVEEAAAELGLPSGTVASRLHRATLAARRDPRVLRFLAD